jgi:hypothetical protein
MKKYETMQMLEKSENKQIRMKFANIAYVLITSMTLVSSIKLIKEGYDRDMHTKTFVHVATETKVCDIEEHFEIMTLEFNSTVESTATVKMPTSNEMLNETSNKKIEMLIDKAPKNQKREKKMPCSITNSEPIIHGKSDREHTMKLNQSDEKQRNPSLNNPHSSRQIDSESEDHCTKTPNIKNDDLNKHKKPRITNQKEMESSHRKTHHKDPNRTAKA